MESEAPSFAPFIAAAYGIGALLLALLLASSLRRLYASRAQLRRLQESLSDEA